MPFNCAIQATLSTFTGCSANSAAANRARGPQLQKDTPEQERRNRVSREIHPMKAQRREAPELVFDPIGGIRQRPIIKITPRHPNLGQPARPQNRIVQQVQIVVEQKPAVPSRQVDQKHSGHQTRNKQQICCLKRPTTGSRVSTGYRNGSRTCIWPASALCGRRRPGSFSAHSAFQTPVAARSAWLRDAAGISYDLGSTGFM